MPYIETTQGVYSDKNVLEGFSVNTELLCNEEIPDEGDNSCEFYDICIKGNEIIFCITENDEIQNILSKAECNLQDK